MTNDSNRFPSEPPLNGTEAETLIGSLERQRATFIWKAGDLDADQLKVTVGASSMTLGGMLKHLALVENDYFIWRLWQEDPGHPLNTIDFTAEPDWEWRTAAEDSPEELYAIWHTAVEKSRANIARVLETGGLEQQAKLPTSDGGTRSVRGMMVDIIEEYARHTGHADLIRESIDGRVGEDPPRD